MATEGRFVWSQSGKGVTFQSWAPGEPNNQGNADCVVMWGDMYNYKWDDVPCYKKYWFVCERGKQGFFFRSLRPKNLILQILLLLEPAELDKVMVHPTVKQVGGI